RAIATTIGPSHFVIARSEATKQSILPLRGEMDCFAEFIIGRRFAPTRWLAMMLAGGRSIDPTVRRREDSRLHAGAGRPLCELPARTARRRRHQGGAARGRGHAPHAAEPRMG